MKGIIELVLVFALTSALLPSGASAADGKEVFLSSKCNKCHTVDSAGIKKAEKKGDDDEGEKDDDDGKKVKDLSSTGADHDAAWMVKWLQKEVEIERDGKKIKHKKKWKGSDDDLKAVSEWLATLKSK